MSISVTGLTKTYGIQQAVRNISFDVGQGEVVGFLGPNGAGKSTTMKIMTGYLAPTSGEVEICGYSVTEEPTNIRRKIGYLPEHNPLYPDMGVIDFLYFSGSLHHLKKKDLKRAVDYVIETCGLAPEAHKNIRELSKGYRQRTGVAHALLHNPDVLILDEPTTGLDPNQIVDIRSLIKETGREKTVLLSSHILKEVEATCSRVIIINNGEIVADEPTEMLIRKTSGIKMYFVVLGGVDNPQHAEQILKTHFPNLNPTDAGTEPGWYIETGEGAPFQQKLADLCREHGWHVEELRPVENSLEDIFQKLTSPSRAKES